MSVILRSSTFKLFVFIASFILLWYRREDILMNAQFWAEDSVFWFKDAYQNGFFQSLLTPRNGYFQTVSTLIVGGTTFLNPVHAPLVANTFGLIFRAIIIWFLFTERFSFLNMTTKVFIAAYFFCMPGMQEVYANITNTHWYLSLYVTMIVISNKPDNLKWKSHDVFFVLLSGLSGPFILFILASTIFKYYSENRFKINLKSFIYFYTRPTYIAMITCALIQLATIYLTFEGARSAAPLGFSLDVISSIISSNVFLFTFLPWDTAIAGWNDKLLSTFISISLVSATIYVFIRGNWQARIFATLPLLIFVFSMAKPQLTDSMPQLPTLVNGEGQRYFVNIHIAIYSLLAVLIFQCTPRNKVRTFSIIYASILTAVMFYLNFFIPPLPDMNWKAGAERINQASHGDIVSFQVIPPRLTLELKKK
ncbi:glucosyl transferase [Rahnella inusitata]|uniref:glucosyl transferase n=1 Tax=Rahnella inusitata TaxID=58169 RepID=UPI0039BE0169